MKKYLLLIGALFLFFSSIHSINAYVLSGYVFNSSGNPLANFPVELEDETEAAEHLFSVSSNALSTPSSTKLYLRENDLLSKEAPTSSGYYSENFRYGASAEWSYTLDGDIDGSYYAFNILLYAYQTTCNLKIIHKKQSGGETILASWTGISTSDPNYYQWTSRDTNSGVNPDASSGDKIIFRVTSANNDKWVSVRFGGVNVQSYILIPSPAVPRTCGCVGKTKIFICEETVTESCTLNCSLISTRDCFTIGANGIIIDGNGFNLSGDNSGTGIYADGKNNMTIKSFNIYDFYRGISLYDSSNNTLTSNTANNNTWSGIDLHYSSNNILKDNIANSNKGHGISLESSSNNLIVNNNLNSNSWYGIYLSFSSDNNNITNNSANKNQKHGLYIDSRTSNNIINSNTFCSNNQSKGSYYDVYDADSNSGDNNKCDTTYNWNDTGVTGCTYSCVGALYNITLYKGWNLISFPLKLKNKSIKDIFKNINFKSIFSYGSWLYYFNESYKNFNAINESRGYWVNSLENQILAIEGTEIESPTFNLNNGWNLIGYPYLEEKDILDLFENVSVYSYNGSWSSYVPNRTSNSLKTLKPGYGYLVKVN